MNRDELYPIIDEVLHERQYEYANAGSFWVMQYPGDGPELRISELAEALCDALCKAVGELTVERDASRLTISDLTAEVERLRAERDAERGLADQLASHLEWALRCVGSLPLALRATFDARMAEVLAAHGKARRER